MRRSPISLAAPIRFGSSARVVVWNTTTTIPSSSATGCSSSAGSGSFARTSADTTDRRRTPASPGVDTHSTEETDSATVPTDRSRSPRVSQPWLGV